MGPAALLGLRGLLQGLRSQGLKLHPGARPDHPPIDLSHVVIPANPGICVSTGAGYSRHAIATDSQGVPGPRSITGSVSWKTNIRLNVSGCGRNSASCWCQNDNGPIRVPTTSRWLVSRALVIC